MKEILKSLSCVALILFSVHAGAQFRVVGYLPNWGNFVTDAQNLDYTKLTHINIAFANPDINGTLSPTANLSTVVSTIHTGNCKALISIGGAGANESTYSTLLSPTNRQGFINKLVQFVIDHNLDGIDVDLEGNAVGSNYDVFVTELADTLHDRNLLITAAVGTWYGNKIGSTSLAAFDFINIMSYDATGPWSPNNPGQHSPYSLALSDLNYWGNNRGVPGNKLVLGVPFYGYGFKTSPNTMSIKDLVTTYPGSENYDEVYPAAGGGIYYNGIPTIKRKTKLAMEQMSGIMIWQLLFDATGSKSLLKAIDDVVNGNPSNQAPVATLTAPLTGTTYTEGDTITVDANATDADGTIMKVEFYAGTYKIGEDFSAPYSVQWRGTAAGLYNLTAIAYDDLADVDTSVAVAVSFNPISAPRPLWSFPAPIPGTIEAENYNYGASGVVYSDATVLNQGGAYRSGAVDIERCIDTGGGYSIGWTENGEWLEYSVSVYPTDDYDLQFRVSSPNSGRTVRIEMDGINISGNVTVPNTSGWQSWQNVTVSNIPLTAGNHTMRLYLNSGGFNINYVKFFIPVPADLTEAVKTGSVTVSPNPATDAMQLDFHVDAGRQLTLELFNATGVKCQHLDLGYYTPGDYSIDIFVEELRDGIYYGRITGETETKKFKVVKR